VDSGGRFAHNLRERRRASGLSQEALGHRAGLHPTEVSRLERGTRDPRPSTLVRLATALEIPVAELVDGVG
jgi:transcriptional regulator with XRE-family HTH domain